MTQQKNTFLESEGDAWFERNSGVIEKRKLPEEDVILAEILKLPPP